MRPGAALPAAFCAAAFLLFATFPSAAAPLSLRPGREISLPSEEVKDTFFGYVLGIITSGVEVDIDNPGMREVLAEFRSALPLPFDLVSRVFQHTDEAGARSIGLDFSRDVSIPIPFALLFYHPGSIVAARDITFSVTPGGTATEPGFVLEITEGNVLIDIDDWLEVLLRAYLEDTWIRHMVFFKWHGDWLGLLEGRGRRTDREVRAFFNFTHNVIVFPTPGPLDQAARRLLP